MKPGQHLIDCFQTQIRTRTKAPTPPKAGTNPDRTAALLASKNADSPRNYWPATRIEAISSGPSHKCRADRAILLARHLLGAGGCSCRCLISFEKTLSLSAEFEGRLRPHKESRYSADWSMVRPQWLRGNARRGSSNKQFEQQHGLKLVIT